MTRVTLTRKLFYRLAPTILVTIIISGATAFFSARHEINHTYDAQLIDNANVLWMLTQEELSEADSFDKKEFKGNFTSAQLSLNDDVDDYSDGRMFRVWKAGKLVAYSDTALPESMPMLPSGFSTVSSKGEDWRVYALKVEGAPITIELGEKLSLRNNFVSHILSDLFWPLFILVPAIGLLLWFGISNGLRAIRILVQQIKKRSPDDLSPLKEEDLPQDLLPLGQSINQLFNKLRYSLDAERRFADQAAHQLRTPLAGLKLQIQMLAEAEEHERVGIMNDLMTSNERASQLVTKLLTAARVSHHPLRLETVFIYNVMASAIAALGPLIAQKQLDVSLEGKEDISIQSDETLLTIMLTNIIENAVKFAPADGRIRVNVQSHNQSVIIVIEDTGPGIPPEQRDFVFKKFSRIDNTGADGTGLGLAIVADIIERLNGVIRLETPANGTGLRVQVVVPAV